MPAISPDFDDAPRRVVVARREARRPDAADRGPRAIALGILVSERTRTVSPQPFAEAFFVRRLLEAAARHGLDAFAFDPSTWDGAQRTVQGWRRSPEGGWLRAEARAPEVLYDRAWPDGAAARYRYREGLYRMRSDGRFTLLNGRLPGKAEVQRALSRCEDVRAILPPSARYRGPASLSGWLQSQGESAFLKPSHGSQGRRVMAVTRQREADAIAMTGRDAANRPFRYDRMEQGEALRRIDRWIGRRAYLMQPLLDLRSVKGEPYDLRVLMQKDGSGRWTRTGTAVRCGLIGSVTANLHGGGRAKNADDYLSALFGEAASAELLQDVERVSFAVVARLEHLYGRFAELGLDYGIDRDRRIWFLEANTKPGRAAMTCAGPAAVQLAADRPLAYARYILLRSSGRVFHEFDPM
ncbi:YheC/YheD family endospore coat-associated protein [Cohnella nanjingensis]|uniref:YheC/YheD family protein n=1 Tax=Cohnella nanjingensis TaxID=1387779 RepID=A0A7X0RRG3_9BACL|nr:YheC/YheD family protein [Cohnella nanjingensis]MBB6672329.1 YheC/YheD family protein [Cohnella nanjingensis]